MRRPGAAGTTNAGPRSWRGYVLPILPMARPSRERAMPSMVRELGPLWTPSAELLQPRRAAVANARHNIRSCKKSGKEIAPVHAQQREKDQHARGDEKRAGDRPGDVADHGEACDQHHEKEAAGGLIAGHEALNYRNSLQNRDLLFRIGQVACAMLFGRGQYMDSNNNHRIRVMLVDAHRIVLSGLQRLIDDERPDLGVVAIATECARAVEIAAAAKPDVVVVDVDLATEKDGGVV